MKWTQSLQEIAKLGEGETDARRHLAVSYD